jgi:competence protein ComEA
MLREDISERFGDLGRRELVGIAVVGILVVAAAGLWYVRSLPTPIRVETTSEMGGGPAGDPGAMSDPAPAPSPSASASPAVEILVHVAGWVHHPGVYRLHQGDRVVDAIEAAGGARAGADLTVLNLAAPLSDGEQVLVGRRGGGAGLVSGTSSGSGSGSAGGGLVNINTAGLEELESLPGIGPSLGQRIIDYREQHGPFHSVDDLDDVSGIGEKTLEDLRPLVTV